MNQVPNSVTTTDTLKGLAVLIVLINHYLNQNVVGDSSGFANAWIVIFFFLSGCGIFFSLNRYKQLTSREVLFFYYRRITRVFPLLWIAWLVEFIIRNGRLSFWILTGIHATGHYWFIPAILHCYLLAPLIYIILKKRSNATLIYIIFLLLSLNIIYRLFNTEIAGIASFFHFEWRGCLFMHIVCFGLGMLMSQVISIHKGSKKDWKVIFFFWAGVFSITVIMFILKLYGTNFMFQLMPLPLIILLCCFCLRSSVVIQFLSYLGVISYSIYLFHISYIIALDKLGSFPKNSTYELVLYLLTFPVFLFVCRYLEDIGKFINKKLISLLMRAS